MLVNYRKVRKQPGSAPNASPPAFASAAPASAAAPDPDPAPAPAPTPAPEVEPDKTLEADPVQPSTDRATPQSLLSPARPIPHKAVTTEGIPESELVKDRTGPSTSPPLSQSPPTSKLLPETHPDDEAHHASGEDTEEGEQEQPVVQLDSNPHILPGWMLRGRREYYRTLPSNVVVPRGIGALSALGPEDRNPLKRLKDLKLERGTSSPELCNGGGTPGKLVFIRKS